MNMLAIPPRLISTLSMAVVEKNWRLSPTTAHVPTNLTIHGEFDVDESDEDNGEGDGVDDDDNDDMYPNLLPLTRPQVFPPS